MKFLTVVGARPQFIKAAVLSRAIQEHNLNSNRKINEIILHTGQHYDKNMSEVFFTELDIPKPKYNLSIGSGNHGEQTGQMLVGIEKIIREERPDYVIVYGDTNSTLAGALAASKLGFPVVHIEAGVRSYNMKMPEEQNRVLTDHISTYLFCPTERAVENLKKEGIFEGKRITNFQDIKVVNSGDIMYDAVLYYKDIAKQKSVIMDKLKIQSKRYILATIHRAENTDDRKRLALIFNGMSKIDEKIILVLHPRTRKYIKEYRIEVSYNVKMIEPVSYLEMLFLEDNAKLIITDSGGVQKEAFFLDVPCVTLREETEWEETIESGMNVLVKEKKLDCLDEYVKNITYKLQNSKLFGSGQASINILKELQN